MMINLTKFLITEDIAIKQVASFHNRLFRIISLVKCLYSQVNRVWRPSVCCWLTRSSILRTSSCCEETTSVLPSTESTDFMMNVSFTSEPTDILLTHDIQAKEGTISSCGRHSPTVSTVSPSPRLLTRRSSVVTGD